ncbi:MAG: DUF4199 domain-containing protein [Lentimicrobium sp.]|nr:DUF4199 domain-containing protein [Lentimicrobium sp.]
MENNLESSNEMKSGGVSLFNHALKFGLFTSGAYILVSLLFYVLDVDKSSWVQYLVFLVLIAGIVLGIIQYRDKHAGGFLSYGKCVTAGILISVVVGLVMAVYIYLFMTYFDPGQIEEMAEMAEQKLVDQGMSDEEIDQAMVIARKFMSPVFSAVSSVFSMAFGGAVISLIAAAFLKKNDDSFEGAFKQ